VRKSPRRVLTAVWVRKSTFVIGVFLAVCWLSPPLVLTRQLAVAKTRRLRPLLSPGADLIIESITLDPASPMVGEEFDIDVKVKNQGDTNVSSNFRVYLYVDPPDLPPVPSTPDTSWTSIFGLNANASFLWSRTGEVFTTPGVHYICAWVDRDDDIGEDNEENNQICKEVMIVDEVIGKLEAVPVYALENSAIWLVASIQDSQGSLLAGRDDITGTVGSIMANLVDDGTEGDFEAQDGLYSAWAEVSTTAALSVTLYAGGEVLDSTSLIVIEDPGLLVVTDFKALYTEFRDTGTTISEDWDADGIIDYLDLLARIYAYGAVHYGVITDLPHEVKVSRGYANDYASLTYSDPLSTTNRFRMAQLVDELIYQVNVDTGNTLTNVTIIGDDQVVPFYRVKDPQDIYRQDGSHERRYPSEVGGTRENPTLIDSGVGYILSDVPYGTRNNIEPSQVPRPYPQMGVGRVFSSRPYQLVQAFDAYKQRVEIAPDASTASLFYPRRGSMDFPLLLEREYGMLHPMQNWYGDALTVYSGAVGPWREADFAARLLQDGLISVWSHSTHLGVQVDTEGYSGTIRATNLQHQDTTGPSILLGMGCHLGYTTGHYPDGTTVSYYDDALMLPLLERGITVFAPSSVAYAVPGSSDQPMPANLNELLTIGFFDYLKDFTVSTVGEAWKWAFEPYHATDPYWINNNGDYRDFYRSVHTAVAYGNVVYGLPTQPVDRTGGTSAQSSETQLVSRTRRSLNAYNVSYEDPEILINIPEFRGDNDHEGRILYSIPQGGTQVIPPNGPPLPLVVRSYLLPADTTVVTVTQVGTPTLTTVPSVTLATSELWTTNGERITNTYEVPNPYPSQMYWWNVTNNKDGVLVTLSVVPLQYDPTSRTVKLYHQLAFDIEHTPPALGDQPTIDNLNFNDGQPIQVNSGDVPLVVDIGSSEPSQLTLFWTIRDPAGFLVASGQVPVFVETGTTHVTLPVGSAGWNAGPMDLVVGILEEAELKDSENMAFLAQGIRIIECGVPGHDYPPEATQATWKLEVRDENGILVAGLASSFSAQLDGQPITLQTQEVETGNYEVRLPLDVVSCGLHVVRISAVDTREISTWREWRINYSCYNIFLPMILKDG
jgi:hypothetical protein